MKRSAFFALGLLVVAIAGCGDASSGDDTTSSERSRGEAGRAGAAGTSAGDAGTAGTDDTGAGGTDDTGAGGTDVGNGGSSDGGSSGMGGTGSKAGAGGSGGSKAGAGGGGSKAGAGGSGGSKAGAGGTGGSNAGSSGTGGSKAGSGGTTSGGEAGAAGSTAGSGGSTSGGSGGSVTGVPFIEVDTVTGATADEVIMLAEGVALANQTMATPCFKDAVLSANWTETNGLSQAEIWDQLCSGTVHVRVEMYLGTWYQNHVSKTIGYEDEPGFVHTNRYFVDTAFEVASNIIHEAEGHTQGFSHYGVKATSVPYGLNDAFEACAP
jgi:hypothetical protein